MAEHMGENKIVLRGQVAGEPVLTHSNHGVDYATLPFRVPRLSGAEDVLNLVFPWGERALWQPGMWRWAEGEVRSFNNRSGSGARLVITVLVRSSGPAGEGRRGRTGWCSPARCASRRCGGAPPWDGKSATCCWR